MEADGHSASASWPLLIRSVRHHNSESGHQLSTRCGRFDPMVHSYMRIEFTKGTSSDYIDMWRDNGAKASTIFPGKDGFGTMRKKMT
jgi:hypothetical protein